MTLPVVSRALWGASAPLGPPMTLPALGVYFHHSVTVATHDPRADMRAIERVGIQRFGRFSYCYAIHPSGTVLEGAGKTVGAHTAGRNSRWFGIVFIGNLSTSPLTAAAEQAAVELLRDLAPDLVPGWLLYGHRDQKATECPGNNVYRRLSAIHEQALGGDDMYSDKDRERDELVAERVAILWEDYGRKGHGVRQLIATIGQRTADLVSGNRPK